MARKKLKKKQKKYLKIISLIFILIFIAWVLSNRTFMARIKLLFYNEKGKKTELKESVSGLSNYSVFGIDVSQYQDVIVWKKIADNELIDFVFIRASAGKDHRDKYFTYNWKESKKHNIIRGAYHYYRPNENSIQQAENFINIVNLEKGDFPPVLDIEDYSNIQSVNSLKKGLLRWLNKVEEHYDAEPIIYTYFKFYSNHLKDDKRFSDYDFWLARYGNKGNYRTPGNNWIFWQYSKTGMTDGIRGNLDMNVYKKNHQSLKKIIIK